MCQIPAVINLSENTAEAARKYMLERVERSIREREGILELCKCSAGSGGELERISFLAKANAQVEALKVLRDQRVFLMRVKFSVAPALHSGRKPEDICT
jgi:hypothetical protein